MIFNAGLGHAMQIAPKTTAFGLVAAVVGAFVLAFHVNGEIERKNVEIHAFMRDCIITNTEQRCAELYRWRK